MREAIDQYSRADASTSAAALQAHLRPRPHSSRAQAPSPPQHEPSSTGWRSSPGHSCDDEAKSVRRADAPASSSAGLRLRARRAPRAIPSWSARVSSAIPLPRVETPEPARLLCVQFVEHSPEGAEPTARPAGISRKERQGHAAILELRQVHLARPRFVNTRPR